MTTLGATSDLTDHLRHLVLPGGGSGALQRGPLHPLRAQQHARSDPPGLRADRSGQGPGRTLRHLGHALKNAALPVVTVIALDLPMLFSGAVVTERSSPGPAWAASSSNPPFASTMPS